MGHSEGHCKWLVYSTFINKFERSYANNLMMNLKALEKLKQQTPK